MMNSLRNIYLKALFFVMSLLPVQVFADNQPSLNQLQRLFTTPFERAQLDAKRRRNDTAITQPEQTENVVLLPLQVEVKGIVKRKNAPNVVWVNDGNTLKGSKIDDRIRVNAKRITSSDKAPVNTGNRTKWLKPGQVWMEGEDKVLDTYQTKKTEVMPDGDADQGLEADSGNSDEKKQGSSTNVTSN